MTITDTTTGWVPPAEAPRIIRYRTPIHHRERESVMSHYTVTVLLDPIEADKVGDAVAAALAPARR